MAEKLLDSPTNNKRIAKNTLLLYMRMFLLMGISLYTSRMILHNLGVEDYGIYNVVGGLVTMFGLISGSMSSATQRFLTLAIGKNDALEINKIFSVSLKIHAILATIIVILIDTVGLWFLNNKMQIPELRQNAAFWVLQFSSITFAMSVLSLPYNAAIIAYEKMSAFAYISIFDATFKLLVVFLLVHSPFDKLITYALCLAIVQLCIQSLYIIYCHRHFETTYYHNYKDTSLLKEMVSFSGWTFLGGLANISFGQGLSMLLNVFFGPTVNAARGIAQQVQSAIQMFISNFQTALNPQITKTYAQKDYCAMHQLMKRSSRFSFFLMLFLSLPVLLETDYILGIWLGTVPDNTVIFLRLIICTSLLYTIINPILVANSATGKVKSYYIVCGSMMISILPISYVTLRMGCPAYCVFIVHLVIELLTQGMRLIIVKGRVKLNITQYIKDVYLRIIMVTTLSTIAPLVAHICLNEGVFRFIAVGATSVISITTFVYLYGFTSQERVFITKIIVSKIAHNG